MNNIGEKYLPIGTIVMLKGGTKRMMITGFCSVGEDSNIEYDYSGCLYPEGFISYSQIYLFNHDQIDKIYFKGFVDEEELMFKTNLNKILNNSEEVIELNENVNNDIEIIDNDIEDDIPVIKF